MYIEAVPRGRPDDSFADIFFRMREDDNKNCIWCKFFREINFMVL